MTSRPLAAITKQPENHSLPQQPAWQQAGLAHIWMPYTQHQLAAPALAVRAAYQQTIELEDGRTLIDGIASWWTACHGYRHPSLVEAIKTQADTLPHIMFAGLQHQPAMQLASDLARITPAGLERVFFSDSGSTSVEVALKMAAQYWHNRGRPNKKKFLAFHHGYHGDTMGCMSLCDPHDGMHTAFSGFMPMQYHVPLPTDEYGFAEFDDILSSISATLAAVILEPLVQAAGGMRFHSADVLAEIYRICKKHDVLFIADEVATGFGRTGYMFACDEAGISPDILCLGKALTGGMMTLAATLATEEIFQAFLSETPGRALMHGPTYMANPLACTVARASLALFEQEPRQQQVATIEGYLQEHLPLLLDYPLATDVRVKGAIGAVELQAGADIYAMRQKAIEHGVWLRPFGNVLYVMPSFTISMDELNHLLDAMKGLLSA